jgi:predicted nucleic acid-binding protein
MYHPVPVLPDELQREGNYLTVGLLPLGISDILIAQNCMQNNLILITKDKHFKAMENIYIKTPTLLPPSVLYIYTEP